MQGPGLDKATLTLGFPAGGCCPVGRQAEDGLLSDRYPLVEIGGGYRQRTKCNVQDADGTAIFYSGYLQGGTEATLLFCIRQAKPYKLLDIELLAPEHAAILLSNFIRDHGIATLNVAGPSASSCPAIYAFVTATLALLIKCSSPPKVAATHVRSQS